MPALAGQTRRRPTLPILRHQDQDLYYRERFDRLGIGYYGHRPMPVARRATSCRSATPTVMPSVLRVHAATTSPRPGSRPRRCCRPPARPSSTTGINGLFSFTTDNMPLIGESPRRAGLLGRRGGLGHPLGRGRPRGGRAARRRPLLVLRPARVRRQPLRGRTSSRPSTSAPATARTSSRSTTSCIRCSRPRTCARSAPAPFHARAASSWARYFLEATGWERPHWYEANAALVAGRDIPQPERLGRAVLVADRRAPRRRSPAKRWRCTT